jgi:cytoskeletal protein CcmA (bactofilin family)
MIFRRLGRKKSNGDAAAHEASGPSLITRDVVIDGNLVTAGELHVDGTIRGNVRARSCVIDMHGLIEGEIVAEEIFVRGRCIGPMRGVHVHLHAGAHVEGDVINESIEIENGAYIYGSIRRSEDPLSEPSMVAPYHPPYPSAIEFSGDEDDVYRPVKVIRPR